MNTTGEILLYQPDETVRLEVKMDKETIWLTQQQIAELFGRLKQFRHLPLTQPNGFLLQMDFQTNFFIEIVEHNLSFVF